MPWNAKSVPCITSACFAGEFSFADVQMTFALLGLQEIPGLPEMPNIRRFLQQMMARDAYVSACRKSPDGGRVTR